MEELVQIIGVPSVILLLILREVRETYSRKVSSQDWDKWQKQLERLVELTEDLHSWASVEDLDGVKRWYVPRLLDEHLRELKEEMAAIKRLAKERWR